MIYAWEVAVPPVSGATPPDSVNTVGIALLAYCLVQVIAKVIDRIPWRGMNYEQLRI